MCDINIINVTFYLLKVLYAQKKKGVNIVKLSKKINGGHFIISN
jgi:hypothetical protein